MLNTDRKRRSECRPSQRSPVEVSVSRRNVPSTAAMTRTSLLFAECFFRARRPVEMKSAVTILIYFMFKIRHHPCFICVYCQAMSVLIHAYWFSVTQSWWRGLQALGSPLCFSLHRPLGLLCCISHVGFLWTSWAK